jgi:type I restriction enzyme R subunit
MLTPEQEAQRLIDDMLVRAGWIIQNPDEMNLYAGLGVAIREFYIKDTGEADYLLFVEQKAVGVLEAKRMGMTLSGVAEQSANYAAGLPANIPRFGGETLPFLYQSTGVETTFRDERDPEPRSRKVFHFHKPETLAEWAKQTQSLRARLRQMPPLPTENLWGAQIEAITGLEQSFSDDRPRSLIQMATGSGKTFTAVNFVYRLIKHAGARRVLFLIDRNNLGKQAKTEFDNFVTPDDGRKFSELYNLQHLQSNALDSVSKVHITTIQRLYSMLKGETEYDPANEEESLFQSAAQLAKEDPKTVFYNPAFPIDYYDFIIIDECHRSIYKVWREALEYFDAHMIGLTATPNNLTFGFFNRNLVMEYPRQRAVADGVNVDGQVYRIRTRITEEGSTVEAGHVVGRRNRQTRRERWESLDADLEYEATALDRDVVSPDQIRTVIRTFRDRLFTEIFPGREHVPKTLIFAKDDNHAEEIVRIVREEFGKGDEFCKKITYKVSGVSTDVLIRELRIEFNPRIAVTVDMIATGTDVRPLEILLFMRNVKSAGLFEQMIGRGTRVMKPTELKGVTPDAAAKTHFVIVDAVGVVEQEKMDTGTLERKPGASLASLLDATRFGLLDEDSLSALASRLARMERQLDSKQRARVQQTGGLSIGELIHGLLDAIDPDNIQQRAQADGTSEKDAQEALTRAALMPLASQPELRTLLAEIHREQEQTIDVVSLDEVLEAGFDAAATDRARQMVESFRQYIEEHKDEITALQILLGQPRTRQRLSFEEVRDLAQQLELPPNSWTTAGLWRAYAQLERDRVRGVNAPRVLSDVVSLVRHAIELDDELAPYPEVVNRRYQDWLIAQQSDGKTFTSDQLWWLDRVAEHIGVNTEIRLEDLNTGQFGQRGGQVRAQNLFGGELAPLLNSLNLELNTT